MVAFHNKIFLGFSCLDVSFPSFAFTSLFFFISFPHCGQYSPFVVIAVDVVILAEVVGVTTCLMFQEMCGEAIGEGGSDWGGSEVRWCGVSFSETVWSKWAGKYQGLSFFLC